MNLPLVKGYVYVYCLKHWYIHELLLQVYQYKGLLQSLEQTESNSLGGSFLYIRVDLVLEVVQHIPNCLQI